MSGEFNYNPTPAHGGRRDSGGFDYPPYSSDDRNFVLASLIPPLGTSITSSRVGSRGLNNPWWGRSNIGSWDRLPPTTGFPVPRLVINNGPRMERTVLPSPSLFQAPTFSGGVEEQQPSSRLSPVEQVRAVEQLKKTTYNPGPKRMASRLCLYYRDQARGVATDKKEDDQEKRCAVCLEDFEPKDEVMLTPCNHMFHEECIVPWVTSHGQCPVCRFVLVTKPTASASAAPRTQTGSGTAVAGRGAGVVAVRMDGDGVSDGELIWFVQAVEDAMMRGNRLPPLMFN